jgi:hypothetical protein
MKEEDMSGPAELKDIALKDDDSGLDDDTIETSEVCAYLICYLFDLHCFFLITSLCDGLYSQVPPFWALVFHWVVSQSPSLPLRIVLPFDLMIYYEIYFSEWFIIHISHFSLFRTGCICRTIVMKQS